MSRTRLPDGCVLIAGGWVNEDPSCPGYCQISGLLQPHGPDVGPDGNFYVVNGGADQILVLDAAGSVVRRWGEHGSGPGQFSFQVDPVMSSARFGNQTGLVRPSRVERGG